MDGIQNVYQGGTDFVSRNYIPKNTTEMIWIGTSMTISFILTDYFLRYKPFRWFYVGGIIILVASWYRGSHPIQGDESIRMLEEHGFRLQG